jgi:hypothetical protein
LKDRCHQSGPSLLDEFDNLPWFRTIVATWCDKIKVNSLVSAPRFTRFTPPSTETTETTETSCNAPNAAIGVCRQIAEFSA